MKLFYTGPVVNTEMLVAMLEKHGINATEEFVEPGPDDGDLSRPARVFVLEADYDRAHRLFYAEREDELRGERQKAEGRSRAGASSTESLI